MIKSVLSLACMVIALTQSAFADEKSATYAPKQASSYSYHSVKFSDPYQWMEKPANQPKLTQWLKAQGEVTKKMFGDDPNRQAMFEQIKSNYQQLASPYSLQKAGEHLFFRKTRANDNARDLWIKTGDGKPRMLIDQKALSDAEGEFTSINGYRASKNGALVVVNLAKKGAEISVIRVIETATGKWLKDELTYIWGEFVPYFSLDNKGMFYTQMVKDGFDDPQVDKLLNMQVKYHRFGTQTSADQEIIGTRTKTPLDLLPREFPKIGVITDDGHVLAFATGARNSLKIYVTKVDQLFKAKPRWHKFSDVEDAVLDVEIVGNELYFVHSKHSPNGELKKVPLSNPVIKQAKVVVAASDSVLSRLYAAKDGLYVQLMDTGIDGLAKLSVKKGELQMLDLPLKGRITQVVANKAREGVLIGATSWRESYSFYQYTGSTGKFVEKTVDSATEKAPNHEALVIERPLVKSFDGAQVPVWIIRHKDTQLDGNNPTIMTAYGGYGKTYRPFFLKSDLTWLNRGGIKVFVNVRGGGAKGRAWYLDGKGKNKYKGVNDFISVAQYMINKGYASNKTLFATGGSMGGVLIGGVLNKRPELFAAAIISVGLVNPLRNLEGNNGANQIDEIGDVNTKDGFDALSAMDPYINIDSTKDYPQVMMSIGLQDQRLPVWHSGKYGAKLQSLPGGMEKTFFHVDSDDGHGVGSSLDKQLMGIVDDWVFFLQMAERAKSGKH